MSDSLIHNGQRKRKREPIQSTVLHQNGEKKILYAVALEDWKRGKADFLYLHAYTRDEVVNQLLQSKQIRPGVRVTAIAPAVGVWVTESSDGKKLDVRM